MSKEQCRLLVKDGKAWCEHHLENHEVSSDWDKHRAECYGLAKNDYSDGPNTPVPFRHFLYVACRCKCGTILIDEEV